MTALVVVASKCAQILGTSVATRANNYGRLATFQIGGGLTAFNTRGIMLFDLSGVEAGTIINTAYVSLFSANALSAQAAQLLEIPVADVGWVEGTQLGAVETGANCWDWHTAATVAWSTGVGCPGGTFIANFNTPTPQNAEVQITLLKAMVQAWVGPAGVNPGLIAKAQTGTVAPRALHSNDATTPALRPTLTMDVTYPSNLKRMTSWPHYRM